MKSRKRCFLSAACFILMLALNINASTILAQEGQGKEVPAEIKETIETFINNFALRDPKGMMSAVSAHYSGKSPQGPVDYEKLGLSLEKQISFSSKKYISFAIHSIEFRKANVKADSAEVLVLHTWSAYNLDTSAEEKGSVLRRFSLAREGGSWKITGIQVMRPSKK